jgi:hypothetical protein
MSVVQMKFDTVGADVLCQLYVHTFHLKEYLVHCERSLRRCLLLIGAVIFQVGFLHTAETLRSVVVGFNGCAIPENGCFEVVIVSVLG